MKLCLESGLCVGHGRCYELAPELFAADESGHALLRVAVVPPELESKARRAADNCPESAIGFE